MSKIRNMTHGLPYGQKRDHAVGGVVDGGTIVASPAAVAIDPRLGLPKLTQSGAAPMIHPGMRPGNRGHAVRFGDTPAQPVKAHSDVGKRVSVPETNPGARGRIKIEPNYTPPPGLDPSLGDAVLDEAVGDTHLPGARHASHTSNMKRK